MSSSVRRGLPRVPGGEPWPPEGTPAPTSDFAIAAMPAPAAAPEALEVPAAVETPAAPVAAEPAPAAVPAAAPAGAATFRRGLPRVAGGEAWPPASAVPEGAIAATTAAPAAEIPVETPVAEEPAPAAPAAAAVATSAAAASTTSGEARQGLPREAGGEPWPPTGTYVQNVFEAAPAEAVPAPVETAPAAQPASATPAPAPAATPVATPAPAQPAASAAVPAEKPKAEAKKYGLFTLKQWFGAGAVIALAIVGAITLVVLAARWFMSLDFMADFVAKYPGEYALPESAPVGFPGWLGWQHFFNLFLMVLIIRSGLLIRRQERPEAFWSSKRNPKKVSIQIWLHQSLNLLWVVNGLIFIILLFATGQWMRVIPTSPEVFPNALSAALQYLTFDWPIENGWVNYNSLQQLAYFTTIFIAAPLSAITGFRMSESWPRESKLSDRFPIEWARKLHFPLMLYFVAFIVVHVTLVMTTGALRNLNHMFAAQGSVDPAAYANNWTGFLYLHLGVLIIIGAWIAIRPTIIAPIARIFGDVSAR